MKRYAPAIFAVLLLVMRAQSQTIVIDYPQFRSTFDTLLQVPRQVEWNLAPEEMGKVKRNPSWLFVRDEGYPSVRAEHSDYYRSGYHRGHMCPAADRSAAVKDMLQTFVISNICPQTAAVNVGSWLQTEKYVRKAAAKGDTISVVVIPVFLHRDTMRIGRHGVAVPHAFFKAAWIKGNEKVIGCWFVFNR